MNTLATNTHFDISGHKMLQKNIVKEFLDPFKNVL